MTTTTKVGFDDIAGAGADREAVEALPAMSFTPVMAEDAFHGLAGRVVRAIEPCSEADPVAILMHVLIGAGNVVGRGPHAMVEETMHTCAEYGALVGRTAKGRKGQAWSTRAVSSGRPPRRGPRRVSRAGSVLARV